VSAQRNILKKIAFFDIAPFLRKKAGQQNHISCICANYSDFFSA
jgi:hypothetical protein